MADRDAKYRIVRSRVDKVIVEGEPYDKFDDCYDNFKQLEMDAPCMYDIQVNLPVVGFVFMSREGVEKEVKRMWREDLEINMWKEDMRMYEILGVDSSEDEAIEKELNEALQYISGVQDEHKGLTPIAEAVMVLERILKLEVDGKMIIRMCAFLQLLRSDIGTPEINALVMMPKSGVGGA